MDGTQFPRAPTLRVTAEAARLRPNDAGHPSAKVLAHGSLEVRWFRPNAEDQQTPHDRDEVYVVVSGRGVFFRANEAGPYEEAKLGVLGEERVEVGQGDVLFVPAGAEHRFSEVTPDFAVWAIFYGPEGGEPE